MANLRSLVPYLLANEIIETVWVNPKALKDEGAGGIDFDKETDWHFCDQDGFEAIAVSQLLGQFKEVEQSNLVEVVVTADTLEENPEMKDEGIKEGDKILVTAEPTESGEKGSPQKEKADKNKKADK